MNTPLVPKPYKELVNFIKAIGFNPSDKNLHYNTEQSASLKVNSDLTYHFYVDYNFFSGTKATMSIYSDHRLVDRAIFHLNENACVWVEDTQVENKC